MYYLEKTLKNLLEEGKLCVKGIGFYHNIGELKPPVSLDSTKLGEPATIVNGKNIVLVKWPSALVFEEPEDKERLLGWIKGHTPFLISIMEVLRGRYVLDKVTHFIRLLLKVRDFFSIYSEIIENICSITGSTIGAVAVYDKTTNIVYGKGSGYVDRKLHGDVDVENTFVFPLEPNAAASKAVEIRDILVINSARSEPRILGKFVEYYKVDRVIVVPMFVENELFGFIYMGRYLGMPEYSEFELETLRTILPYLLSVIRLLVNQEYALKRLKALLYVKTLSEYILSETNPYLIFDIVRGYYRDVLGFEDSAILEVSNGEIKTVLNWGVDEGLVEILKSEKRECILEVLNNEDEEGTIKCLGESAISSYGYRSMFLLPLKVDGKPGLITIIASKSRGYVSSEEQHFIKVILSSIKVAMKNLSLYEKSIEALDGIVEALSQLESKKDLFTASHSRDVAEFALKIASSLGLSEEDKRKIYLAGLLHDLGKVIVERAVLLKTGPLNAEEWEEIRLHPLWGAEILKNIRGMEDVAKMVEYHHEKFDGTGYPHGLKGEEIPLGARILSIADAVVTMLSNRPYRRALNKDQVIFELLKEKGKQFDPKLVDLVIDILRVSE